MSGTTIIPRTFLLRGAIVLLMGVLEIIRGPDLRSIAWVTAILRVWPGSR